MKVIATPPDAVAELTERRTLRSKTFDLGGQRRRVISRLAPVHVPGDFAGWERGDTIAWQDPDPDIELRDGFLQVKNCWYGLLVDTDTEFRYRVRTRRGLGGEMTVRLIELGPDGAGLPALNLSPVVSGNRITFADVVPGLTFILECRPARVKLLTRIANNTVPRRFVWRVSRDAGDRMILDKGFVWGSDNADRADASRESLSPRNRKRALQITRTTTELGVIGGLEVSRVVDDWTSGRTFTVDPATHVKTLRPANQTIYPVEIDPDITEPVAATGDDGNKANGSTNWEALNHYYYGLASGEYAAYAIWPGWRFTSVAVPAGATIDLANLIVQCSKVANGGINALTLHGDDVDDAAAFANGNTPGNFTDTTATASLVATSTGIKTIAVTTIIAEICGRGGWVSGNDIRLGGNASTDPTGVGTASFEDVGSVLSDEGILEIDYTEGGGGGRTTHNTRSHPLGIARGVGWRIAG